MTRTAGWLAALSLVLLTGIAAAGDVPSSYFDITGKPDAWSGGARMIPITTPRGTFKVWTKRVGNNPRLKVLLLHGGPGGTHEGFEVMDSFFPAAGIEYYYYDQLGSWYSDQPKDPDLWELPRFVEEVEQVRVALGLDKSNFVLMGQSWGGLLAMEYALRYQANLKGLVISNMVSSIPAYNKYAHDVLMPAMDPKVLAEVLQIEAAKDYKNPRYMALLTPGFYEHHLLRRPAAEWPEPINRMFGHLNYDVYTPMQGPSEMGASGKLENWDRSADIHTITVPTLVIGARYDTMDPAHMEWMSKQMPHGKYLYCPNGSHCALYDDQKTYFDGLVKFLKDLERRP